MPEPEETAEPVAVAEPARPSGAHGIMQVILKAKPLLTRCVPAHAHGKLTLQITIDPKGHVQHAKVHESTLHGAHVEACVTKVVHRLRFSPPEDGKVMIVNFPLMFRGD